ncbi:MAG TPA: hypothetical protein DDY49_03735 [Paenibacillaceae bacterium]|nr:hypothetical protein [Paenibacillaceae bacterium]
MESPFFILIRACSLCSRFIMINCKGDDRFAGLLKAFLNKTNAIFSLALAKLACKKNVTFSSHLFVTMEKDLKEL